MSDHQQADDTTMEETQEASSNTLNKPLFRDITAEDYDPEITEIESLCINCEEQGMTRLLLTKIPFFREVVVASFHCDQCGYRNAELQPGGRIQDRGASYKLTVKTAKDLNRQVVQTANATISIPSLEFEIPSGKSGLTTVEGVIDRAVQGLEQDQVLRRIQHPEVAAQIDEFVKKLQGLKAMEQPFQFILDDPSGNSFVENPQAPSKDPQMVFGQYARTTAQDEALGILEQNERPEDEAVQAIVGQDDGEGFNSKSEVLQFQTNCPRCASACDTNMKVVNIPHFKEVVIMATNCDKCGMRDNEVKSAGGFEEKGRRLTLRLENPEDMARDVLKSETASLEIPELDLETQMGTLGGKFTTVEGLLVDIKTQLQNHPFFHGDSSQADMTTKLHAFCGKIDEILTCQRTGCHFVLDDPAGNSFIQSLTDPEPDTQLTITIYERSHEQNEELGLNDMKTENYGEDEDHQDSSAPATSS